MEPLHHFIEYGVVAREEEVSSVVDAVAKRRWRPVAIDAFVRWIRLRVHRLYQSGRHFPSFRCVPATVTSPSINIATLQCRIRRTTWSRFSLEITTKKRCYLFSRSQ